jgi:gliding motility-associated-like protein
MALFPDFFMKNIRTSRYKLLILVFLFSFAGSIQANGPIRTYIDDHEVCPGESFLLPVHFENVNIIDAFSMAFTYDPTVIEYIDYQYIHPGLFMEEGFEVEHQPGIVSMSFTKETPIKLADGVMIIFVFEPIADFTSLDWDLARCGYFLDEQSLYAIFENGSVEVLPEIIISLVQLPEKVCPESFDASMTASVSGGTPGYEYQWIGSPIQVLSDSIARNLAADRSSYILRITDNKSCVKDTTFVVETHELNNVEIKASPDTVFISNPTVTFTAENLSDPFITNYFWRIGDFGDTLEVNTPEPTITYTYHGAKRFAEEGGQEYEISLTITNEFGCDTTIVRTIPLREAPIFIPNVFTPNGDGANDEFRIVRDDDKTKIIGNEYLRLELLVFNRWGKKLYSSDNYRSDWDGGNTPDGVYFYVVRAIGFFKIDTYKGAVHILR